MVQAHRVARRKLLESSAPLWILHRAHHLARLIEGNRQFRLVELHATPVDVDDGSARIDADSLLLHDLTPNRDTPLRDKRFARTARAKTRVREHFLKAYTVMGNRLRRCLRGVIPTCSRRTGGVAKPNLFRRGEVALAPFRPAPRPIRARQAAAPRARSSRASWR